MPVFPLSLSQWKYRKKITISGSSGAGTNYQVLLKIGESSGATGYDFHLEGLSAKFPSGKNDGGDLRFTASDGTTLQDFWVESVTGTSPNRVAYVWVKVSADLGTNKDIYIYFGNPNATNASNGDNTFLFFDDFEGTSVDTNKWNVGYGTISVANSILRVYYSGTTSAPIGISTKTFRLNPTTVFFEIRSRNYVASGNDWIASIHLGYNTSNWIFVAWGSSTPNKSSQKRIAGTTTIIGSISSSWNTWVIDKLQIFGGGNTVNVYQTDTLVGSSSYVNNYDHFILIGKYDGGGAGYNYDLYTDYILVRKYVSPEPAFSSAGSLEKRSSIIPLIFIR